MRVLFFHREGVQSARVRILQLVPHLEALGIGCQVVPHPTSAHALRQSIRSASADVFVLQKKLPTPADAWAWRGCGVPLVFDYDDAIMFRQQPRNGSYESGTRRRRFARVLRMAGAFVVGNAYLGSFAEECRKPILVAPSPVMLDVPLARVRARENESGEPVRIGWLGSPGNLASLTELAPALRQLARDRRFRLIVVSEARPELPGVPIDHVPWTLEAQEREVAALDVGLMPLADTPWSRGKCSYKLLQYMAAGVPVVASPVGMNREVVSHEENGLLATGAEEWQRALERLIDDVDLAARLGRAGRETVVAGYGYTTIAAQWKSFLEQLATG